MSSKIGLAILGAGIFAREEHLPAIERSGLFDIKAVYSRSNESAEAFLPNGSLDIYSDDSGPGKGLDDLLSRNDIQAVDVALPINNQPDVIKKALRAGKHVISEKPVGPTIAEAKELISFYKSLSSRPIWSVAEQFRYNAVYDYIASIVPQIGKFNYFVQQVNGDVNPGDKRIPLGWRGSLCGRTSKDLAFKDCSGSAFTRLNREYLPPVDTIHATWKLEDGATGLFGVTFASKERKFEIEMMGEEGSITGQLGYGPESVVILKKGGKEEKKSFKDANRDAIAGEFAAFGKAVLEGKADKSGDPEEALADLAILEYMLKSGEAGGQPIAIIY